MIIVGQTVPILELPPKITANSVDMILELRPEIVETAGRARHMVNHAHRIMDRVNRTETMDRAYRTMSDAVHLTVAKRTNSTIDSAQIVAADVVVAAGVAVAAIMTKMSECNFSLTKPASCTPW